MKITDYIKDKNILDIEKYRVFFLEDPQKAQITSVPENTYLVYHKEYNPPKIDSVVNVDFETYKNIYLELDPQFLILVGLNKIVMPSSRCDFIQEHLSTLTQTMSKISIDKAPFIGEPWRLFFHYLYTNNNKFGFPHSYVAETEWKHWYYRDSPQCLFSPANLQYYLRKTYTNLKDLTTTFQFQSVKDEELIWYEEAKKHVFGIAEPQDRDEFSDYYKEFEKQYKPRHFQPKSLINGLAKICNKKFKIKVNNDMYLTNQPHIIPKLPVFDFIIEENYRRLGIYNMVIKCGNGEIKWED